MSRSLLIGTGNRDKVAELRTILAGMPWTLKSLADFPAVDEPNEDESTFEGNALLKARYYAERFQIACVADDSGLEVDALDGAPGLCSARYAGEDCTYADNNRKLLAALAGVAEGERGARFVCCAAFLDGDGEGHVVRGVTEGRIAEAARGGHGFGYDPVFVPDGYSETFGELDAPVKHGMSHRGRAFRRLRSHLESLG